jgi:hypothetical protein
MHDVYVIHGLIQLVTLLDIRNFQLVKKSMVFPKAVGLCSWHMCEINHVVPIDSNVKYIQYISVLCVYLIV